MGMENLLNYYFIMKKRFVTVLLACSLAGGLFAQQPWFKDKDLTLTGAYYYPEHWDESQWERDFKQMHDLGFEFTHFAEFAWAQLEPEEGKYDFSWLDKAVALAAKYDLIYSKDNIDFYIMKNIDEFVVLWKIDNFECQLSGTISREEFMKIIDSI